MPCLFKVTTISLGPGRLTNLLAFCLAASRRFVTAAHAGAWNDSDKKVWHRRNGPNETVLTPSSHSGPQRSYQLTLHCFCHLFPLFLHGIFHLLARDLCRSVRRFLLPPSSAAQRTHIVISSTPQHFRQHGRRSVVVLTVRLDKEIRPHT